MTIRHGSLLLIINNATGYQDQVASFRRADFCTFPSMFCPLSLGLFPSDFLPKLRFNLEITKTIIITILNASHFNILGMGALMNPAICLCE